MSNAALPTAPSKANAQAMERPGVAGEAIASAGMWCKVNSSGLIVKGDRDADADYAILCLDAAASGDPVRTIWQGVVGGFSGLTPGTVYYLSDTAGRMCPIADVSGNYVPVCVALSATHIWVFGLAAVQATTLRFAAKHVGPLADQGADATVTVKLGKPATGRQWIPIRLHILSGTTADATAQLKFAGTGAHTAEALDGDTEVTTFTDNSAAAGQAVTVDLVTAESTGDLDAAVIMLEYLDAAA